MKVLDAMKLPESTHKLVFGFCVLVVPGLFIPQTAFCQTEKLGIVKYTPPPGWNKTQKENVIAFSKSESNHGRLLHHHGLWRDTECRQSAK